MGGGYRGEKVIFQLAGEGVEVRPGHGVDFQHAGNACGFDSIDHYHVLDPTTFKHSPAAISYSAEDSQNGHRRLWVLPMMGLYFPAPANSRMHFRRRPHMNTRTSANQDGSPTKGLLVKTSSTTSNQYAEQTPLRLRRFSRLQDGPIRHGVGSHLRNDSRRLSLPQCGHHFLRFNLRHSGRHRAIWEPCCLRLSGPVSDKIRSYISATSRGLHE